MLMVTASAKPSKKLKTIHMSGLLLRNFGCVIGYTPGRRVDSRYWDIAALLRPNSSKPLGISL